jgi:hypothetical protein
LEKAWPAVRLLPLIAQDAGPDGPYRRGRGIPIGHSLELPSWVSSADAPAVSPINQAGLKVVRGSVPEYQAMATAATRLRWYVVAGTRTPFDGHDVVKGSRRLGVTGASALGWAYRLRCGLE